MSATTSSSSPLSEFERLLQQLEHWPNKRVIYDLTSIANRHTQLSGDVADIIVSRVLDRKTNIAFKVPLYYLVDSILRNVAGAYVSLFAMHIAVAFRDTFIAVNKMDQARLDFLLSSWEARRVLPPPVLAEMRHIVGRRIVTTAPPRQQPPPFQQQQQFRPDDRDRGRDRGGPMHQQELSNPSRKRPFQPDGPAHFDQQQHHQHPTQHQQNPNIAPGLAAPRPIRALIGEVAVKVDAANAQHLAKRLATSTADPAVKQASQITSARLNSLLTLVTGSTDMRPPLPRFLTDKLPTSMVAAREAEILRRQPKKYLPVPEFIVGDLMKSPKEALQALYHDRSFFCRQDGSRFSSQAELAAHLDVLFRLKEEEKRNESIVMNREWFCKESLWVSNFGAHSARGGDDGNEDSDMANPSGDGGVSSTTGGIQGGSSGLSEEMIVPADEHFTRCPVSNEAFIPEWDDEEGDYMYRSAVKVLVAATTDDALFERCQPTAQPRLRYAIVHQLLVMDGWLSSGKAITVQEALRKLQSGSSEVDGDRRKLAVQALMSALGEEDDEDDVFVTLDPQGNIGTELFDATSDIDSEAMETDVGPSEDVTLSV